MYEEDEGVSPNLEAALNGYRSAAGRVTQQNSGNLEYQQRAITADLQFVHIRRLGMLLLNQRGRPDMPMQGSDIF